MESNNMTRQSILSCHVRHTDDEQTNKQTETNKYENYHKNNNKYKTKKPQPNP